MQAMRQNMSQGAPEVATAYLYRSAFLLARIATILGRPEDEKRFAKTAEGARNAYRWQFVKDGRIRSERQCAYVRPMAFGLLEKEELRQAAADLAALIEKGGGHLNTGFLSTPDLCRVLAENGQRAAAYQLLLQDTCPSWLYAVKKGATSIWETWDGVRADGSVHDSLNHYSYGAVSGWLFGGVCGISLDCGKLTVRPQPGKDLGWARAEWRSPVGTILSAWEYRDGKLLFEIRVPVPAVIELPDGRRFEVEEGEHRYEILL
jgi:alpha-L-rhamnosidase